MTRRPVPERLGVSLHWLDYVPER